MSINDIVLRMSKDLNVSPDYVFANAVKLLKAEKTEKLPGIINNMPMGFVENYQQTYNQYGVKDKVFPSVPDEILKEIERKNPIVSSCSNLRCREIREFSRPVNDEMVPGWNIIMKDARRHPSRRDVKIINRIKDFFLETGFRDFEGHEEREDSIHDVMVKTTRDYIVLDKVAIEIRRNERKDVIDFWALDSSTIRRVAPGGYRGHVKDFDSRMWVVWNDDFFRKLSESKIEDIPPLEEIAFVQEINGKYVAAFRRNEMIFDVMQKRTDMRHQGEGYSMVEQSLTAITAFLNGLAYNSETFKNGSIPKLALVFEEGNYNQEQMEVMQDQWISNFRGISGQWKVPFFNGKVNMLDLMRSPRDMEYGKYLELTGALICSVFGVDPAEIGLRFMQAQNVLNENQEGKMQFTKDRALRDLLGQHASLYNKIMNYCGWGRDFSFVFCGLNPADPIEMSRLRTDAVRRDKTINEIRAEQDLKPIEYGDILLDPAYLNYITQKEMAKEQQQGGGGDEQGGDAGEESEGDDLSDIMSDDEINGAIEESIEKARSESRVFLLK